LSSQIRVSAETKKTLEKLKVHPRETYDDVIRRLINTWKSTQSR
jgi:predicted CopG family antitoxin